MKSVSRLMFLAAVGFCAFATGPAQADTFTFTSCHISGGCTTPATFGTVTLTQSGTSVNFTVSLSDSNTFVETGAGGGELFLFNDSLAGSTITGITSSPVTPGSGLSGFTNLSPVMADGTGTFTASVECTSSGDCNGASGPPINMLAFTVTNATLAQLETPNANGNIFVADILCGATQVGCSGGLTGPVDVSVPSAVPLPGALPLFATGLVGLGLLGWSRKRKTAVASLSS